ncbi:MAG: MFS transporter [Tannerella sp.]|jgi:MFS family permease|nr:MFS transporter [Tannerella sp.]
MTQAIQKKLNDSPVARWSVLAIVSITMMCGYFITDVMAPLQSMLETNFGWDGGQYGLFTSSYGWFNVTLFMLIIGGIILDKKGMRFTGTLACGLMLIGCAVKYYAISPFFTMEGTLFGINKQVLIASLGYATFGVGVEIAGITVTKVIARWFKGKEIALAMGLQVAMARIGTALALSMSVRVAKYFNEISMPVLLGLILLCIGLIAYLVFCVMDRKLDASIEETKTEEEKTEEKEDGFRLRDIGFIVKNKGFWLIAILCVLFYSAVFPFLKYATSLMINKYGVEEDLAGIIPSLLPFGTILLTPIFGNIYDKIGKGATIMILGSFLLILVHACFALPLLNVWWFATVMMIILGIAFSLVPSAMWPSVPKIIPQKQLGTAYSMIFWVQNIGLSGVPLLIGIVLKEFCITGVRLNADGLEVTVYDYTLPMIIFTCFGILAVFVAFMLKAEDKKKGYGLEQPNIKKEVAETA